MVRTHVAARGTMTSFVRQVALSVVGTFVATALYAGLQSGYAALHPTTESSPELTSGGKFAARVEALGANNEADLATVLPPSQVPLLMADAAVGPAPAIVPDAPALPTLVAPKRQGAEYAKPARHLARLDAKRRLVSNIAAGTLPPKRAEVLADPGPTAALADTPLQATASNGVWSSTKALLKQAVWLGGSALDRIVP